MVKLENNGMFLFNKHFGLKLSAGVLMLLFLFSATCKAEDTDLLKEQTLRGDEKYIVIGQIDDLSPEDCQESKSRVRDFFPIGAWIANYGRNGWSLRENVSFAPSGWHNILSHGSSEAKLPDLEYPLSLKKLKGKYKIFVVIRMTSSDKDGILVKLSGDENFSLIKGEIKEKKHTNCEIFWKEAEIGNENIILRHPDGYRSYVYGIKLVPVGQGDTVEIKDLEKCAPEKAITFDTQNWKNIESLLKDAKKQNYNTVYVSGNLLLKSDLKTDVSEKIIYLLNKASENNLKVILPEIIFGSIKERKNAITREEIYGNLKSGIMEKIKDHSALLGYYLVDEPEIYTKDNSKLVNAAAKEADPLHPDGNHLSYTGDNLRLLNKVVKEVDPKHPGLSCFCRQGIIGGTGREWNNIRSLFNAMEPDVIMNDFYPFRRVYFYEYLNEKELLDLFAQCIDDSIRQTGNANIPLWMVIQSFGIHAREIKMPTPEGLRAQVGLSIAHGAKGVFYFSFLYSEIDDGTGDPEITEKTTRTIGALNKQVQDLSPILLKLKRVNNIISSPGELDVQTHVDKHNGGKYIFITNKDIKQAQEGSVLIFQPGLNRKIAKIYDLTADKEIKYESISQWKKLKYKLPPGGNIILSLQ